MMTHVPIGDEEAKERPLVFAGEADKCMRKPEVCENVVTVDLEGFYPECRRAHRQLTRGHLVDLGVLATWGCFRRRR